MKNKELFDKTISILVNAYQKETLRHSDCSACAVGNMVAANMGLITHPCDAKFILPTGEQRDPEWYDDFFGTNTIIENITGVALMECKSTGYSVIELVMIEEAFESPIRVQHNMDLDGFMGLMSVVDCLMQIHEATIEEASEAKQLFIKA